MRKALIVGIDDYTNCPLYGCCNDADAVSDELIKNGDGSPNFAVRKVLNVQTKGELRRLVEECFSGCADVALFYYSGHGHVDTVGGYLVTPDYTVGDYGLSLQDVLTIANKSQCKDKVIILDSCYSGTLGTISTLGQNTSIIGEGVTILTASHSTETSVEINGHGLFTSLLLEALKGGAADVTRIKGCDVVVVICGKYTNTATGVSAELKIAQEEGIPYFLLYGRSTENCVKPIGAKSTDKMYKWTWDNLKALIGGSR